MAKGTKKTITFQEKLRVYETLKEHIEILDDGYCRYSKPEMTDATIATMVDPARITVPHVSKIRKENFGILRDFTTGNNSETLDALRASIATLSASLDSANKMIEQLTTRHDKLCQSLSVNKVLDVRHLTVLDHYVPEGKGERHPAFQTNGNAKQATK